jgi:phenylacetate-CoA ligase
VGTTVVCATSSFALLLAELVDRRELREELALRVVITGVGAVG